MSEKKENAVKLLKDKKKNIWNIIKRYLANSSIHGVKYLVEDDRHWTEKIFWLTWCFLSWWGCSILISSTITDFITHKVDITMDTNYLNWEIEFPALHLCFYFSGRAKDYAANITGIDRRKASTMVRLTKWSTSGYEKTMTANITSEQFMTLGEYIRPSCTDIFGKCIWNNEDINCCDIFIPMETNLGQCLSFNSIHTSRPINKSLPKFIMSHHKQMATFTLYLNKTTFWNTSRDFVYLLLTNIIEYPSRSIGKETYLSVQWNKPTPTIWDFNLIPSYNDKGVVLMPYNERNCRFPTEIHDFRVLKVYSYHGCLVEEQMKRSEYFCNCISHLYPSSKTYRTCNYTELSCVFKYRKQIVDVIDDICLPDCEETKIISFDNLLADVSNDIPNWAVTKLIFNMLPSPTIRYSRYTVHSLLDIIVSLGSTLGLFTGASVLSVIELFYWLFIRRDNN